MAQLRHPVLNFMLRFRQQWDRGEIRKIGCHMGIKIKMCGMCSLQGKPMFGNSICKKY